MSWLIVAACRLLRDCGTEPTARVDFLKIQTARLSPRNPVVRERLGALEAPGVVLLSSWVRQLSRHNEAPPQHCARHVSHKRQEIDKNSW